MSRADTVPQVTEHSGPADCTLCHTGWHALSNLHWYSSTAITNLCQPAGWQVVCGEPQRGQQLLLGAWAGSQPLAVHSQTLDCSAQPH